MTQASPENQETITEIFKEIFGHHPAGVAIITADSDQGPVGLTASSVSSISADPAILGFSLAARRGSAAYIADAKTFLVHLLDAENVELAKVFATHGAPRFGDAMNWKTLPTGEPLLTDVSRVLRCQTLTQAQAGPALVFTAEVLEASRNEDPGTPLVYHRRAFHSLGDHSYMI
ncbi:flavin reductase family protein [Kocuria sp. HSID16901]|uniref:flavin reductase family protein n=1 Tax=Kocuria sp. HSID16901 TaxID=2419505 RepID=UPI00066158F5|nr:flavin reductase family protein [Kocuria sp. HSID16901]MCT1367029.1 flavin reductase family protein [Rothia sp. p3-SID1597]RUQ21734.1 flavin reductase [Kocuria sp. HSID16901]